MNKREYNKFLDISKGNEIRIRLPNGEPYYKTLYTTPQQLAIKLLVETLGCECARE